MLLCLMREGSTPSSPGWGGVPHPVLAGGGYPIPGSGGGYPIQSWPGGYPIQSWLEGVPHPVLAREYPPSRPGMGYPPVSWMGYPPHPRDLGWGNPPISWMGYPPPGPGMGYPPPVEVWTDKQTENSTFPHPLDAGGNYACLTLFFSQRLFRVCMSYVKRYMQLPPCSFRT